MEPKPGDKLTPMFPVSNIPELKVGEEYTFKEWVWIDEELFIKIEESPRKFNKMFFAIRVTSNQPQNTVD